MIFIQPNVPITRIHYNKLSGKRNLSKGSLYLWIKCVLFFILQYNFHTSLPFKLFCCHYEILLECMSYPFIKLSLTEKTLETPRMTVQIRLFDNEVLFTTIDVQTLLNKMYEPQGRTIFKFK